MDLKVIYDLVLISAYMVYWIALIAWTFFKWKILIAIVIPLAGFLYNYLKNRSHIRSRY